MTESQTPGAHNSLSTHQKNNRKGNAKAWIIGACAITIAIIGYLNFNYITIGYAYLFQCPHFDKGDKVYVSQSYFDNKRVNALGTLRLIRPITSQDIGPLGLTDKEVNDIKLSDATSLKPYVLPLTEVFDLDEVKKQKSGYIGTFIKSSLVYIEVLDGKYMLGIAYVIEPNKKVFTQYPNDYEHKYGIPKNYTFANKDIYLDPLLISNAELSNFR
ncbi:hypothetical protein AB6735_21885 [Mucilaginibacter sp. RCC_168]|uniref:hypothetical protein n=1 Tax=Mucilaginibacter sp. RCC_168 TaxID=3239221 RepID=UPI0035244578